MAKADRTVVRTLDLGRPIEDCGATISQLAFVEPTGEVLEILDRAKGDGERTLRVIAHLTGVGVEAVKTMAWRDVARAGEIVGQLLGEG